MKVFYKECNLCGVQYKFLNCLKHNRFDVYIKGEHDHDLNEEKDHGIHPIVKDAIIELLSQGLVLKPKAIHVYLSTKQFDSSIQLPNLSQGQSFVARYRKKVNSNSVTSVKEFILSHLYNEQLKDDDSFVFGVHLDKEGNPIVGIGSEKEPFRCGITSKKLLQIIEHVKGKYSMFHIDSTYKLINKRFPLVVFGLTDINRTFHPIAFMVISSETNQDYYFFYKSFIDLCLSLKITFLPTFIMQDAADSMAIAKENAFQQFYGYIPITIMCWYHVRSNIKKKESIIPKQYRKIIVDDIYNLHNTLNAQNFHELLQSTIAKWQSMPGLDDFKKYSEDQWLKGRFINWQIYNTPAGFSTTNSPIESFNKQLKETFTNYEYFTVSAFLQLLDEKIVKYYSIHKKEFSWYSSPTNEMVKLARNFTIEHIVQLKDNWLMFIGITENHYMIVNENVKYCNCKYYLDKAICYHIVAVCILKGFSLVGLKIEKNFVSKIKRGRQKKAGSALNYD